MSLLNEVDEAMTKGDGFNLKNCGYAVLLVSSYVAFVLIGAMIVSH